MLSIKEQIKIVKGYILQAERSYKSRPEGTLIVSERPKSVQYYHQLAGGGKYKRTHLHKTQDKTIRRLAQAEYDGAFLKEAYSLLNELEALARLGAERSAMVMYDALSRPYEILRKVRKELVTPYVLPREEYIKKWLTAPYHQKGINSDISAFMTENEERVRSKSEKIIADKLYHMGIPYHYEEQLVLGGVTVHPDFTILDSRERTVCYYEHFGMMQNLEYCRNALSKMAMYEKAGYRLGREFFCTFESEDNPLDVRVLESVFRAFS